MSLVWAVVRLSPCSVAPLAPLCLCLLLCRVLVFTASGELSETSKATLAIITKLWRGVLADVVSAKLTKSLDFTKCVMPLGFVCPLYLYAPCMSLVCPLYVPCMPAATPACVIHAL
jgi:hypothetical protein